MTETVSLIISNQRRKLGSVVEYMRMCMRYAFRIERETTQNSWLIEKNGPIFGVHLRISTFGRDSAALFNTKKSALYLHISVSQQHLQKRLVFNAHYTHLIQYSD